MTLFGSALRYTTMLTKHVIAVEDARRRKEALDGKTAWIKGIMVFDFDDHGFLMPLDTDEDNPHPTDAIIITHPNAMDLVMDRLGQAWSGTYSFIGNIEMEVLFARGVSGQLEISRIKEVRFTRPRDIPTIISRFDDVSLSLDGGLTVEQAIVGIQPGDGSARLVIGRLFAFESGRCELRSMSKTSNVAIQIPGFADRIFLLPGSSQANIDEYEFEALIGGCLGLDSSGELQFSTLLRMEVLDRSLGVIYQFKFGEPTDPA